MKDPLKTSQRKVPFTTLMSITSRISQVAAVSLSMLALTPTNALAQEFKGVDTPKGQEYFGGSIQEESGRSVFFNTIKNLNVDLQQGEKIIFDVTSYGNDGTCTLGFVDNKTKIGYTAKHCGYDGEKVFVKRDGAYVPVGYLKHIPGSGDQSAIVLYNNVNKGINSYSGDTISAQKAAVGDKVCRYGYVTGKVDCATVRYVGSIMFNTNLGMNPVPGDSGGPSWIEGKGYMGTLQGHDDVEGGKKAYFFNHIPLAQNEIPTSIPQPPKSQGSPFDGLSSLSSNSFALSSF